MQKTLAEIAQIIGGKVVGDDKTIITGLCGIKEASAGDITFIGNPKYVGYAEKTNASAVLVSLDVELSNIPSIKCENPSYAFAQVASHFTKKNQFSFEGVHPQAIVDASVKLGENVRVGPGAVVEANCKLGENAIVYAGCYVGHDSTLGDNCIIYPNVTIREFSVLGNNIIVHSGTVIGSDGFGYEPVDGKHFKIPQLGNVVIEDDVEIGANVTIDRARFDKTVIGKGTKIDNLCQIGHNTIIGENCIIISQVGISGSTTIGNNCVFAGQVGVSGHLTIGDGSVAAAQSGVYRSLPANSKVFGYPARDYDHFKKVNAHLQRLPQTNEKIKELEKRIKDLEDSGK